MRMRQSDGMCKLTRVERRQVLDDHGLPSEIQVRQIQQETCLLTLALYRRAWKKMLALAKQ
jgi:hypothetical protein